MQSTLLLALSLLFGTLTVFISAKQQQQPTEPKACSMFSLPPTPEDPVFALNRLFTSDPSPLKISCGIGAYRDNSGNPTVLSCVKKAKEIIGAESQNEYLPIAGDAEFLRLSRELCFGDGSDLSNVESIQSLSGTGGLYLSLKLLKKLGTSWEQR